MSRIDKQRSALGAALLSIGAAAIPLVAGVGLTLKLSDQALHEENVRIGQAAVERMDKILSAASDTADILSPMVGKRCQTVLSAMRRAVAQAPWVRSASYAHKNVPYCNTVSGSTGSARVPVTVAGPFDYRTLELQRPDAMSEGFGSLLLTKGNAQYSLTVRIDNRVITEQLELISGSADVALHVAGTYLWDDGSLLRGELRQNPRYRVLVPSTQFSYAIHSSLSGEDVLNLITRKLLLILGPVLMLSIFSGGLCHWLLSRPERSK